MPNASPISQLIVTLTIMHVLSSRSGVKLARGLPRPPGARGGGALSRDPTRELRRRPGLESPRNRARLFRPPSLDRGVGRSDRFRADAIGARPIPPNQPPPSPYSPRRGDLTSPSY